MAVACRLCSCYAAPEAPCMLQCLDFIYSCSVVCCFIDSDVALAGLCSHAELIGPIRNAQDRLLGGSPACVYPTKRLKVLWRSCSQYYCHHYTITCNVVLATSTYYYHDSTCCILNANLMFGVAAAHADKALFTQLSLDTREVFLQYQHNSDAVSDVTFNVKDFRHMLSMCESLGASVAIRFDQPGAPLVVEPHFRGTYVRLLHSP